MSDRPEVLVVGSGVMGCATAYWLAKDGARVALLDRDGVAAGASGMSAALVGSANFERRSTAAHVLPPAYAASASALLAKVGAQLHEESGIDVGFRANDALQLAFTQEEADWLRARSEDAPEPSQWVDADAAREREPDVSPDVLGAVVFGQRQVLAGAFCTALARVAEAHGCDVQVAEVVDVIAGEGTPTVTTRDGTMRSADAVVLAMGPWTAGVEASLGLPPSVFPVRGQLALLRPERLPSSSFHYDGMYVASKADGTVVAGATEEPEAGFELATTTEGLEHVLAAARHMVPALRRAELVRHAVGLRPASRDGLPLVGEVPGRAGIHLVTGHFRGGMKLGLLSGKLVADSILGRELPSYFAQLSPARLLRLAESVATAGQARL